MDMTAEFYLSTVERIFKNREIARNEFDVDGTHVDIGAITDVAVKVVEGEKDDISAPGQCLAALDLLTGLPDEQEGAAISSPAPGHYGIFAGRSGATTSARWCWISSTPTSAAACRNAAALRNDGRAQQPRPARSTGRRRSDLPGLPVVWSTPSRRRKGGPEFEPRPRGARRAGGRHGSQGRHQRLRPDRPQRPAQHRRVRAHRYRGRRDQRSRPGRDQRAPAPLRQRARPLPGRRSRSARTRSTSAAARSA